MMDVSVNLTDAPDLAPINREHVGWQDLAESWFSAASSAKVCGQPYRRHDATKPIEEIKE